MSAAEDQVLAWAASGAMALTGPADGPPLGPPDGFVPKLAAIGDRIPLALDPLALLGERAALLGLRRRGPVSCGGAARLLAAADGWVALSLARDDDVALLPAWLGIDPVAGDDRAAAWDAVASAVAGREVAGVLAAAEGLGLPIVAVPPAVPSTPPTAELPVAWTAIQGAGAAPRADVAGLRVVDLTSLWAGPLCGSLLAGLGADVVKVEAAARPDGARSGAPAFFDLLDRGKRSAVVDLATAAGRAELAALVAASDVVLEASRPRALRQLGIVAEDELRTGPGAWVSITAHGRSGPAAERVGFGDDAAAGGGLLVRDDTGRPAFCADAIADPLSGLVATAAVLEAVARGGRWLIDVAMSGVARHLAGPTLPVPAGTVAAPPRASR